MTSDIMTNEAIMTKISVTDLKDQAKRLRTALEEAGNPVSHSKALELVSRQNGYRDWNTASASLPNEASNAMTAPFHVGDTVSGTYLGKPFTGQIKGVSKMGDLYRVNTSFDQPVDVVEFESFSNLRSQVWAVLDKHGISPQKTSNGKPQMALTT